MKSMRVAAAMFGGLIVLAPLSAVAGPEFLAYEGKYAIQEGQGGGRKTVDGVDFWMSGTPPRKFQVLGSLTDRRHESGLYGAIRMSALDHDIAKAAKDAGGDAVILQGEGDNVVGVAAIGGYTNFATVRPIKTHDASYIVVRYLPDETAPAAARVSAASPAPAGTATPAAPGATSAHQP